MLPPLVSCAIFGYRSLWSSSTAGSFCVPPSSPDGKDTAMKKKETTKRRKSQFNPNRTCYLTADGKYYCYEYWDSDSKRTVRQMVEVGKDLSLELTIMLDEYDHETDLKDRYAQEHRDARFDTNVSGCNAETDDEVSPWDKIADNSTAPEPMLFSEPVSENPLAVEVRRIVDEKCTEEQKAFYYGHFGQQMQLEEMRQAEAERTGKLVSSAAMTNRKNKLIEKVAKALGVERVKRRKSSNKD